jgi:carbon monoxide dehydrogenase subunit G
MIIQSSTKEFQVPLHKVKEFLSIPKNLVYLLPKDKVSDFQSNEAQCSFKAQGGINIHLDFVGSENHSIHYRSGNGSPFVFTLTIKLEAMETHCSGHIVFDGEINGFLKMMVEKPLKGLFEEMGENLSAHFQQN